MFVAPIKAIGRRLLPAHLRQVWERRSFRPKVVRAAADSWTATSLRFAHPEGVDLARIEFLAARTQSLGPSALWSGYNIAATRTSEEVRTRPSIGRFFTKVVMQRQPELIVEFGTAFGVSGMYWLAGLEHNRKGQLLTFEPNEHWATIAQENLSEIGHRFTLTLGTFEDHLEVVDRFPARIGIGFIDAIHTSEFVFAQLDLLIARCEPGALIFLDDIGFSPDMENCWQTIAGRSEYSAVAEIDRVGLIELRR
jgi:predicted O-methyltransferase YrrM